MDAQGVYTATEEDERITKSWKPRNITFIPVRPQDGNYNLDYYN